MTQPDFSASPGKVWPFGLVPTVDAPPGPALDPLDPRQQLYLSSSGPLLTAFQAAHVVAFGGVLAPAHYQAEAWIRLHEGADLGRDRDHIATALRTDLWLAVRLYLRHRGLERPMIEAEKALQAWAEAGLLRVHGRRMVQGMTGLRRAAHSPIEAVEFMSGARLAIFGNRLGEGPVAITDLRFRLDDPPVSRALSLHLARFTDSDDTAAPVDAGPGAKVSRVYQKTFALDPENMRRAADLLDEQPLSQGGIARHLAALYRADGHLTTAKDLADNMKVTLSRAGYTAEAIATAIGWTGAIAAAG